MESDQMLLAFLNGRFTSLDDLYGVDKTIKEVQKARADLQQETANAEQETQDGEDSSGQVDALLVRVNEVWDNEDLDGLDRLIASNGSVELLKTVRAKLVEKLEFDRVKQMHDSFVELSTRLDDFEFFELANGKPRENLAKLEDLCGQIRGFASTAAEMQSDNSNPYGSILDEYSSSLNQRLSSVITDNFRGPAEEQLKKSLGEGEEDDAKMGSKEAVEQFSRVLELQLLDPVSSQPEYPATFWAFDGLCHKFKLRFVYHFEGRQETNRLDKPEYALEYVLGYISKTLPRVTASFKVAFHQSYPHASLDNAFITSVVAVAREKFRKDRDMCLHKEKLLSHLIAELQKFDSTLVEDFGFCPVKDERWGGLTYDLILSDSQVFEAWFNSERDFVNHRYDEIVNADDAFIIDYDFLEAGKTQPTKSAINMGNLLEGITAHYENLALRYQLRFLSDIQLKLLNFYFTVLKQGIKALDSVARDDDVSYAERLCRVWCSAEYMIEDMEKWGERLFFVELWNSINPDNDCQNTFFDSVVAGYRRDIVAQIAPKLKRHEERQLNMTMKEYFRNNISWSNVTAASANMDPSELQLPISTLQGDLRFFQKTVSRRTFRKTKLFFSEVVADYFYKTFVNCNTFNREGAEMLRAHFDLFYDSLDLPRDTHNYGRISEMIRVFEVPEVDVSEFHILSAQQVYDLTARRAN